MMRFAAVSTACLVLLAQAPANPAMARTAEDTVSTRSPRLGGWLRGTDPGTTGSLEASQVSETPPAKSACPPQRRVGTGVGFCLIN